MRRRVSITVFLGSLFLLLGASPLPAQDVMPLRIKLRPAATVNDSLVLLGDIAELTGGVTSQRKKLAQLDITEMSPGRTETMIPRDQVFYRLRLAGLAPDEIHLDGAGHTTVHLGQQAITRDSLSRAAEQAIRQRLPRSATEIALRLMRPIAVPEVEIKSRDHVRLAAEVISSGTVGKVRVDVAIFVNGERKAAATAWYTVTYHHAVAVARRRIAPGEILDVGMLRSEVQLIDGSEDFLTLEECLGRKTKASIPLGQRLTDGDVDSALKEEPILIRARDSVRLIAQVGALRVTALGEALQEGRLGQTIRVRNVDSNKVLSGRVIDQGQVQIDY